MTGTVTLLGWIALAGARALGAEHGRNAAEWWVQDTIGGRASGDTKARARRVLDGIDSGDPEILDGLPSDGLSGEWVDSYTSQDLYLDLMVNEREDASGLLTDAYAESFNMAVQDGIGEACNVELQGPTP